MRVIGGEFRSRRLKTIDGVDVRPTPDRLRETLFNVIALEIPDSVFLDAYAGSGAVGIEALSRGAGKAILIEKNRKAAEVIGENLASLGLSGRAQLIRGSAKIYLGALKADIVFLDPPYDQPDEYYSSLGDLGNTETGLVVAQHHRRLTLDERYGALEKAREIRQGDNLLSFYRRRLP